MNTTIETEEVKALPKVLPPLIKGSSTYKLIVPNKVEEKIRYLQRKFPTTEWSGVLFYKHTGSFETDDLVITCQDIYPMDLGTATYTEYNMDPSVTTYLVDHIELFDCDMSLVHSHNQMSAFFSGTDLATLRSEGNEQNCFVSLIVNNTGPYCAAVTRKIQKVTEVVTRSLGTSYEFFGEGAVKTDEDPMSESTRVVDDTVIEYFMLDVEREEVTNPLDYLDLRFEQIEAKKKANKPVPLVTTGYTRVYDPKKGDTKLLSKAGSDYDEDKEFYDWIHSERKKSAEAKEAPLFDKETMDELVVASEWAPDPTISHSLTIQLITCSLIVSKDLDLKQWAVKWMTKKYDEIFKGSDEIEMENWADFYVEFILNHYDTTDVPVEVLDDFDEYLSKIAMAILGELEDLPKNFYIDVYDRKLTMYVV